MAIINQSLMTAFGMVVIAGIVGETIYGAARTLDIATSINAAIAIVILTGPAIAVDARGKLVISVMAGVPIATIAERWEPSASPAP